mgnify:CR=1 FL=1
MRFLPLLIIFVVWLNIQLRKNSNNSSDEKFWARERQANLSRSKDISSLDYITIDLNKLPLDTKEDQTLNSYRDTIVKLANKKILNLSGLSNTDLKEKYGIGNLQRLIEYENNYMTLVSILHKWAQRLYDNSYLDEARTVLEYALSIKSDVPGSYKLLAKIYRHENRPEKIEELIRRLSDINIHDKEKLIRSIKELIPS